MAPYWPENFLPAAEITNDDKSSVDSTSIPANITAPSSPIGSAIPLSPAGSFYPSSPPVTESNSPSSSSSTSPYTLFYVSIPCSYPSCYYIPIRSSESSPTNSPASPTSSGSVASLTPNRNGRKRAASLLDERFKDLKESHKYYPPPRKMLTVGVTVASANNWYEVALGQDVPPADRASTDATNPPPTAKKMWLQNYLRSTTAGQQNAPAPAENAPVVMEAPAVDAPAEGVPAVVDAAVNVQAENAPVGPTLRARPIRTSPLSADRRQSERTGRGQLYREYLAGSVRQRKRTASPDDETALPSRKRGRPAKRRK